MDPVGSVPARDAYADFCRWARASGIEPCTETRFGRDFTARIIHLGGVKVKRRDRAYYHGVAFENPSVQETAAHSFTPDTLLLHPGRRQVIGLRYGFEYSGQ